MSTEHKVAKKYAKALFELSPPAELESIRDSIREFAALWKETPLLRSALTNPAVSRENRASVMQDISQKVRPGDANFLNFLMLLQKNDRVGAIEDIAVSFAAMIDELKKLLALEVTSAFAVPESERQEIAQSIKSKYGQMASIAWREDTSILGGLLIKSGDRLLDSSVRGSLEKIRASLVG